MAAGLKRAKVKDAAKMVRVGKWSNSLVRVVDRVDDDMPDLIEPPNLTEAAMIKDLDIKVTRANHARPIHEAAVDPPHVGDLRNISDSVAGIPGHLIIGNKVRAILDDFLDKNPNLQAACLESIGAEVTQEQVIPESDHTYLRSQLVALFASVGVITGKDAHLPCSGESVSSSVCGLLLHAWAQAAGDPAASIALWFRDGAPADIRVPMDELEGVMPHVRKDETPDDPASLETDYEAFTNHGDLENDPEVLATFQGFVDAGYLHSCDSLEECTEFLGPRWRASHT